jgi:Tol biopolymer transport system component
MEQVDLRTGGQRAKGARRPHRVRGILAISVAAAAICAAGPASASSSTHDAPSRHGIIVWTDRTDAGDHLMIARADGSHRRSLTPVTPDEGDIDAQVSPDGRWVMYEHDNPQTSTLRLVHPDGTGAHDIPLPCTDPCIGISGGPTWLTNHRIAYVVVNGPIGADGNAASVAVFTARPDGSDVRRFSPKADEGRFEYSHLRLSPDRSYVTFRRGDLAVGRSALFRADPDGRHPHQLTSYALDADVNDLSKARRGPTKDLLVFESFGRGDAGKTFVDIATVPTTCGSLSDCASKTVWLTDNGATGRRNANPNWSPDGSSIVFTDRASVDISDAEIWTMRYLGGSRRQISMSPDFDFRPTWGVSRP